MSSKAAATFVPIPCGFVTELRASKTIPRALSFQDHPTRPQLPRPSHEPSASKTIPRALSFQDLPTRPQLPRPSHAPSASKTFPRALSFQDHPTSPQLPRPSHEPSASKTIPRALSFQDHPTRPLYDVYKLYGYLTALVRLARGVQDSLAALAWLPQAAFSILLGEWSRENPKGTARPPPNTRMLHLKS